MNGKPGVILILIIIAVATIIFITIYNWLVNRKIFNAILRKKDDESIIEKELSINQKKEISDTILLANSIQSALLTPGYLFQEHFSEHFIFFKPKQFVGGDFYWMASKGSKVIVAVADCTGHGVSGALMSLLGIACLYEIVNKSNLEFSDEVLNLLKDKILKSLPAYDKTSDRKEGMDIAICIFDRQKMEAQYSGAYNSLYIISNNNLEILRADRIAIGLSEKSEGYFTRHNFNLKEGDIIYMFTDGYCDQFGGENRKKFMSKRFSHLLLSIYEFPMEKQKEWIDKTLTDWMNNSEQVDDITVIGLKI